MIGKVLLALLILLGAGLYFPESREVLVERSRPLLNPGYRWMTAQQMERILLDLENHEGTRGELPSGLGEFDDWLDQRYPQESSREDAWGTRYRLDVGMDELRVISAGPDGEFGTESDLIRSRARGSGAGFP